MVHVPPMLPEGTVRQAVFVVLYLLFVVCTTMQVCGLRSTAQICIRHGKGRATYGMVNGIYLTIFYTVVNVYVYSHLLTASRGFNLTFFKTLITIYTVAGFAFLLVYLFFFCPYDRQAAAQSQEKRGEKVRLADIVRLFRTNRPFRMLILSAGTDKLATTFEVTAPENYYDLERKGHSPANKGLMMRGFSRETFKARCDLVILAVHMKGYAQTNNVRVNYSVGHSYEIPWSVHEVPTLCVSLNYTNHLFDLPMMKTFINAYAPTREYLHALVEKITGRSPFQGKANDLVWCGRWETRL